MGLFVAPVMLVLRRLNRADRLQLPLKRPGTHRVPEMPEPLLRLKQEARALEGEVHPPPPAHNVGRTRRGNPRPAVSATRSPTLAALNERPIPVTQIGGGWGPALYELAKGKVGACKGPHSPPKGGFLKSSFPVSKTLAVLNVDETLSRWLIYSASLRYLILRDSWTNDRSFKLPPKPRKPAMVEAHRTFVKCGAAEYCTPTEDTMNLMGIPSYVYRMKHCQLTSRQKGLATLGRLTQLLVKRGEKPRVRGFTTCYLQAVTGVGTYVRFPPKNWRRALRLVSRQLVSTFASPGSSGRS